MYRPSGSQFIFNPAESRKNYIKMALLTNESNKNHTPYEAREVDITSFDLSDLHSTGLEQESYGVHDI